MTLSIKHPFVSAKGDGPDSTRVRPTAWNAEHQFTTDEQGIVLGRDTTGSGNIQELPLGIGPDGSLQVAGTGQFTPPAGTTLERPATPNPGAMRFNLTTNLIEIYGVLGQPVWTALDLSPQQVESGQLGMFPIATLPANWFLCNGQAISRSANPKLFLYIGTTFGVGDGSTTFNVPNWLGRALVCVDPTNTLNGFIITPDQKFGAKDTTLSIGNLPPHTHGVPFGQAGNTTPSTGGGNVQGVNPGGSTDSTGSGAPFPQHQPSVGVSIAIRGG